MGNAQVAQVTLFFIAFALGVFAFWCVAQITKAIKNIAEARQKRKMP